jgi:hypothetical protein
MKLTGLTYVGPSLVDVEILPRLSKAHTDFLADQNGFIAFDGGLHVRGACFDPFWHSIRLALEGPEAFHCLYPVLTPTDIPFAQAALGDQFVLRQGIVHRLDGETGDLESLDLDFPGFLNAAASDPIEFLHLHPLLQFQREGGTLAPGQLLSAYPPFCVTQSGREVSLRAISARDRLGFLADLARQIHDLPEGARIEFKVVP